MPEALGRQRFCKNIRLHFLRLYVFDRRQLHVIADIRKQSHRYTVSAIEVSELFRIPPTDRLNDLHVVGETPDPERSPQRFLDQSCQRESPFSEANAQRDHLGL